MDAGWWGVGRAWDWPADGEGGATAFEPGKPKITLGMVQRCAEGLPLVELLEQVWELGGIDRNGPGADHLLHLVRHRRCWLHFHL